MRALFRCHNCGKFKNDKNIVRIMYKATEWIYLCEHCTFTTDLEETFKKGGKFDRYGEVNVD